MKYAQWLAGQDLFDDALDAYGRAGRTDLCLNLLEQLSDNAISEKRFEDAAYYFWVLSESALKLSAADPNSK